MKKIIFPVLLSLLVFAGCTSQTSYEYDFEDFDFEDFEDFDFGDFEVSDISLDIDYPTTATLDEGYDITIEITNDAAEEQLITSLDIGETYLEGIIFEGSTPEYQESWDLTDFLGIFSYDYYIDLGPGETQTIIFHFTPFLTGDYQGDLDVCINTEDACLYNTIRTVVSE